MNEKKLIELCQWMNDLASKVKTGVKHEVVRDDNGKVVNIRYTSIGLDGKLLDTGLLL